MDCVCVSTTLLLSPSIVFTLIYVMITMVGVYTSAVINGDVDGPIWKYILILTLFLAVYGIATFFILQNRELKRFY